MLSYKINSSLSRTTDNDNEKSVKVDISLGSNFALDGMQDLLSDEMFFQKIKDDVLPDITDMEKIVIYPAVYSVDESGNEELSLADEIEINMHFRRRWGNDSAGNRIMNDGWLTNDTLFWTTGSTNTEKMSEKEKEKFLINYDERSDLVGYLGFIDDDIYYQKTKVKKSFLRLLFYDSKDLLNKNLLTYSTPFLDSGKLFTKYSLTRNNEELFNYTQESEKFEDEMVMFEPGEYLNGKFDNQRLSTMITLKDKYNDDASSDGFYIYMFKQDAPLELPIDLYLKAEFNNAKYGKTVNLMIPIGEDGVPIRFNEKDEEGNELFPKDFIIESPEGGLNFDFESYYNSMFINIKCKYDKTLKKYVYYFPWNPKVQEEKMDEETKYTVSNDVENKKITLNFFEPKLNRATNLKMEKNGRN